MTTTTSDTTATPKYKYADDPYGGTAALLAGAALLMMPRLIFLGMNGVIAKVVSKKVADMAAGFYEELRRDGGTLESYLENFRKDLEPALLDEEPPDEGLERLEAVLSKVRSGELDPRSQDTQRELTVLLNQALAPAIRAGIEARAGAAMSEKEFSHGSTLDELLKGLKKKAEQTMDDCACPACTVRRKLVSMGYRE